MVFETAEQINKYYDTLIKFLSPEEIEYDCKLDKGLAEYCAAHQDAKYSKFIENATPEDLKSKFFEDKYWKNYYLLNKDVICKKMLQKYEVNYADADNLIYRYVHLDTYYTTDTGEYKFPKIYKLFLEYYEMEELDCSGEGVSSMPKLPKLKKLICSDNDLQCLPVLENLEELVCLNNRFIEFPGISNIQKEREKLGRTIDENRGFPSNYSGFPKLKLFNGNDDYSVQLTKHWNRLVGMNLA